MVLFRSFQLSFMLPSSHILDVNIPYSITCEVGPSPMVQRCLIDPLCILRLRKATPTRAFHGPGKAWTPSSQKDQPWNLTTLLQNTRVPTSFRSKPKYLQSSCLFS